MLFNSFEFLYVFLPATLLGFYLLGRVSRQWAILWLILTSLVFYGWWRPLNVRAVQRSLLNVMENIDLRPPRAVAKRS